MTLADFITKINYALRGTDDDAPAVGDDDWNYWVSTANRKKDEWVDDTSQNWLSNYHATPPNEPGTVATAATTTLTGTSTNFTDYAVGDTITVDGETARTIATITSDTVLTVTLAFTNTVSADTFTHTSIVATGVQDYSIPRTLVTPSDEVCILLDDGNYVYYDIIKPQERDRRMQQAYISGRNPEVLTFVVEILSSDQIVGCALSVPGYYRPADIDDSDEDAVIEVDDPNWLVMATAAQIAFNDLTYEDKFGDLTGQANILYRNMARRNRKGSYKNPRVTPTRVRRITGFR